MVFINLNILNSCSSTNDLAFEAAQNGAEEGVSFLSYNQTNGRGRNNNKWRSIKGNLFISTIIKPKINKSSWHQLSLIVGFSILDVLNDLGVKKDIAELKWPNDVLNKKSKITGVLLESLNNFVVAGIGLNVSKVTKKKKKWKTTKLNNYVNEQISLENIGTLILNKVFLNYGLWEIHGFKKFYNKINPYIRNINNFIFFKLTARSELINGIFLGLGENGGLKIKLNNKITEYFSIESFSFSEDTLI